MLRNIFKITAEQVVVSESHPEGILSVITGFPKYIDSRTYGTETDPNGNTDTALIVAQAEYADEVKALTVASNPSRVMWAVTLEQANGVQIARKSYGAFPDMTPIPPEPTPNAEPAQE